MYTFFVIDFWVCFMARTESGSALVLSHVKANKSLKLEKQLSMEHGMKQGPEVLKYVCHYAEGT